MNAGLVERLAAAAHEGWMKARIAQGFADHTHALGTGIAVNHAGARCNRGCYEGQQHHPNMVPYADLPEKDKEASRQPVRAVLEYLMTNRCGKGSHDLRGSGLCPERHPELRAFDKDWPVTPSPQDQLANVELAARAGRFP